jgi:type VI secretion system protein ImpG
MNSTPLADDLRYITAEVLCTSRDLPLMLQQEMGNSCCRTHCR